MRVKRLGLLVISCCLYATGAASQENANATISICSIAQSPEQFNNQMVSVKARVFADGQHGSMIYDESCDHFGISLFVVESAKGRDKLDFALNWCHWGTRGKILYGIFTGVFRLRAADSAGQSIEVQRIEGIVLQSAHTGSASFPTPCPDPPAT